MIIEINVNILKKIKKEKLLLQDYIAMEMIYSENNELLEEYLSPDNQENLLIVQGIWRKGYIELSTDDSDKLYKLTEKGNQFLSEVGELFEN